MSDAEGRGIMTTPDAPSLPTRLLLITCAAFAAAGMALAQDGDAPPLGVTGLAQTTLSSAVETPLHFRLLQVTVEGGASARYATADGMVYQISGTQTITVGDRTEILAPGRGTHIGGGTPATFEASAGEEAVFLHFILVPAAEAASPTDVGGADAIELYLSPEPLRGLAAGAYAFDLTLLEFPAHYPINDPHYRTGGALYYVLSGSGEFTAEGTTERKPAGSAILEPYGLVHQWANPHDDVTAVVVANLSPVGRSAFEFGAP
jgi:quercetin dioxygenase-like cupin family protein